MPLNEADTCRIYVIPRLREAGWEKHPHSITEQKIFTDGRVEVRGGAVRRKEQKRADYLLRYTRDFPIAVVEAKPESDPPGKGLQQAKEYADILGLKFAYATNGRQIIEFDYLTGKETELLAYPLPAELFSRLKASKGMADDTADKLLTPYHHVPSHTLRYYQEIAINRTVQAILQGKRRNLLTMATGTGKTVVAFQICWKLWNARWNREGAHRKPRILFLADRNVLVDDPKDKTFAPFGDARHKIEGEAIKSREMYFAIYQAIAKDARRPGLYREYPKGFFDLIIVDECHRGSARDDSNWREILEYFELAYQLGMTATPLREDNRDTYDYFGNALYTYSLRQGIEDGFLAPYRVHRVVTEVDAAGWRPSKGQMDRYGREIPDGEYHTKDFEWVVALRARTEAIARHLAEFMRRADLFAKTIVFCVDQEHADEMRRALNNLSTDLVRKYPNYVVRVTSEEGKVGKGHLSRFQDLESTTPVILTTSQLLTTGVDVPTCKNVVLARVVNSMTEFKQIIGRGTRIREDYGKTWFNILDYTGSATRNFADPAFDGFPEIEEEIVIDEGGYEIREKRLSYETSEDSQAEQHSEPEAGMAAELSESGGGAPRKFYVDSGHIEIAAHLVYELDADGKQLRVVQFADYTAEKVRTLFTSADELQDHWADPLKREEIILELEERGIAFRELAEVTGHPEADPLDLLCHLAFDKPLRNCQCDEPSKYRLSKGDVLVGRTGSIGKTLLVDAVPEEAVFASYLIRIRPKQLLESDYLFWCFQSAQFWSQLLGYSRGSAIKNINGGMLQSLRFPVPHLDVQVNVATFLNNLAAFARGETDSFPELDQFAEQRRIVAKIESLAAKIDEARQLREEILTDAQAMLRSAFHRIIEGAEYRPMAEVAPIVRRPVAIELDGEYPELGVRSFGKGTFHKPVLNGMDVGTKKLYHIHPGDLVFSNVFAWEGDIAVVQPEDVGRVGSHRFITCVAKEGIVIPDFLCFYLLTDEGIEKIREASPGGAGRNRTLGLKKLEKIQVPVPPYDKQRQFNRLQAQVAAIRKAQASNQTELDALLPAILDRAFKGAL